MRPNTDNDRKMTGDLGGVKHAMTIDENSLAHIMSVLTDLYSDNEMAVIREYASNAWDSHVEAGIDRPIEVTLPNVFSPFYKIKDYGVGMSVDDVIRTYSKYGASTKRYTDDQTGMLGLGCKSALTYTNQFTVVAVKGGVKTTVSVSRVEDGTGIMEIVDTSTTDEPNGVEIVVPAKRSGDFVVKAREFFRYWQPGQILIDEQPATFIGELTHVKKITEDFYVDYNKSEDTIVMGGVAYPLRGHNLYAPHRPRTFGIVAFVEMGRVNFTPSREQLNYTTRTKKAIEELREEFTTALVSVAQADVDTGAKDRPEALKKAYDWYKTFGKAVLGTLVYDGETIPLEWQGAYWSYNISGGRYNVSAQRNYGYNPSDKSLFIHGLDDGLSSRQKAKIRKYIADNNLGFSRAYTSVEPIGDGWISVSVPWEEVNKVKLYNPKAGPSRKSKASYIIYTKDIDGKESTDIDTSLPIYYFSPANKTHMANMSMGVAGLLNATVVCLGENRWDKFLRDYPSAVTVNVGATQKIKELQDGLSTEEKFFLLTNTDYNYSSAKRFLELFEPGRINDPEINKWVSDYNGVKVNRTHLQDYEKAILNLRNYGFVPNITITNTTSPFSRYPLLGTWHDNNTKEHLYIYMNAVYAARCNGQVI